MNAIIASDNQTISTKLRHALVQLGYECLIEDVFPVNDAADLLEKLDRQPDFVLIVLPEDKERCLQDLKRFKKTTSARIVAVGAGDDPLLILGAVREGADDYLIEDQDFYQQLSSIVSRLTAIRETRLTSGQLTIVACVGGGCGASVIAGNLAVLIAREREECTLLDFDARSGDQAALFNLKPRHSLPELCHSIEECDCAMLDQSLAEHECGVLLLAGSQRIADNRYLSEEALRKIARIARSAVHDVVIDVGCVSDGGDVELLQGADRIVLVFRQDIPSLRRLRLIFEAWDEVGIDRDAVHLVANSCGQSKQLSLAKIQAALCREILLSLPDDRKGLNLSIDSGNPVVLECPKSPFARAMMELGTQAGLLNKSVQPVRNPQSQISRMSSLARGVVLPLLAREMK